MIRLLSTRSSLFALYLFIIFGAAVIKSAASTASPEGLQGRELHFQAVIKSAASAAPARLPCKSREAALAAYLIMAARLRLPPNRQKIVKKV